MQNFWKQMSAPAILQLQIVQKKGHYFEMMIGGKSALQQNAENPQQQEQQQ